MKRKPHFTKRERDAVLAALRYWQDAMLRYNSIPNEHIATNDGTHEALTAVEVDRLCEQLNR